MEHFDRGEYLHLPSNYQGIYYDGDVFVIQISDEDQSPYDFLSEYGGLVRIETVKYTRKELEALRDIPWNILKDEHSIDVVSNGIDHKNNAIEIEVFDRYTDEEKAEIASYVEDYPVIIKYVDYHHITAAEALDMLYNSFEFNERGTRDYPDDYAGYYFDGDFGQDNYVLAVLITDENSTRYDFLKGYEKVRFETAEHSLNELWEIRAQLPSELIKELDLPFLGAEINMRQNIIDVTFDETCSEEQRAAITEYAADKPVTVGYAPKPYPELQSAI
ncbi:MAG: hypothetical protein K2O14_03555 [Oscillospiraceae bacterium]|nr:hypothetical protein [Oscillospiraceae bacterium]